MLGGRTIAKSLLWESSAYWRQRFLLFPGGVGGPERCIARSLSPRACFHFRRWEDQRDPPVSQGAAYWRPLPPIGFGDEEWKFFHNGQVAAVMLRRTEGAHASVGGVGGGRGPRPPRLTGPSRRRRRSGTDPHRSARGGRSRSGPIYYEDFTHTQRATTHARTRPPTTMDERARRSRRRRRLLGAALERCK